MRFEELPANIQMFLDGKPEGYYRFPGIPNDNEAKYLPLNLDEAWGPLSSTLIVSPDLQSLSDTLGIPPPIGFGRGFERIKDPITLESEALTTSRLVAEGNDWRDPRVEFHSFQDLTFVCTDRMFRILSDNGALHSNMWRNLYQETPTGIVLIPWKIVDFPRTPIIDFTKSEALWNVSAQYHPGTNIVNGLNYTVEFNTHQPAHWTQSEGSLPPIGRDTLCNQMFITRRMLHLLQDEAVIGPDYGFLDKTAPP